MSWPVQGLWIGDRLTTMERLCIESFLSNGHDFDLYAYQPVDGLPEGATWRDANEILPACRVFRDPDIGSFSGFADLFRYKLLFDRGGWWMDLDVVCLRKLPDPVTPYVFALENAKEMGNCVLFSHPGGKAMEYLWTIARGKDPTKVCWCEIGPPLVQEIIDQLDLRVCVFPPESFCPIPSSRWYDTFVPGRRTDFGSESYGVHLWHEMWRRAGLDKDEEYGPRSLYEVLKLRYGVRSRHSEGRSFMKLDGDARMR